MCDTLVALGPVTDAGVTLFAKNSDRPPHEVQHLEWLPARRDRGPFAATYIDVAAHPADTVPTLVSRPSWCWGVEHGVNLAGVAIGNEAIYTTSDPRAAEPALTGMDLVRLGLERATTAAGAVAVITELLERYGQGGSGHDHRHKPYWSSFLVSDPTSAWVIETSGRLWATEEVADVRAISNRTTIDAFDRQHRHPRQPVATTVDPRWNRSRSVLAARPVTREALLAHLRSHDDGPWSVCMHVDDPGAEETTTASMLVELPADGRRPVAWCAQGSPCGTAHVRVDLESCAVG
jgi:secernin